MSQPSRPDPAPVRQSIEIAVNLLLVFLLVAWCLQIIAPFINFVIWGAVIAISVHVPFCRLRDRIGAKLAVAVFTIVGLGVVLVPAFLFAGSLLESVTSLYQGVQSRSFDVPPPNEQVQQWPVVGERLYTAWSEAAANVEQFLEDYAPQLENLASFAAGKAAGIGLSILSFVLATLIAAFMLARDAAMARGIQRLGRRLMGEHGEAFVDLSVATIRSVTVGVLGIAVIQALGTGLGMWLVGVPGTGLWALLVLILVIAQLPALLVMLPVIVWVFSQESTTVAVVFAVWSIAVSMSDTVLKPMLLGRGVDAPMLVILLGAIGGMLLYGILGLFVGAVVLALGYRLFMIWLVLGSENGGDANREALEPEPADAPTTGS